MLFLGVRKKMDMKPRFASLLGFLRRMLILFSNVGRLFGSVEIGVGQMAGADDGVLVNSRA